MISPSSHPGDKCRVTIHVEVDPAVAFEVFTEETDLWWKRGPQYRISGRHPGTLQFEPGPNGRLFERVDLPSGPRILEVGRITVWDPPSRLVFEWRAVNFKPDEKTEVEILFERASGGTRVTLEHRGWSAIRPDHPARHKLDTGPFLRDMGMWWSALLGSMREHASTKT